MLVALLLLLLVSYVGHRYSTSGTADQSRETSSETPGGSSHPSKPSTSLDHTYEAPNETAGSNEVAVASGVMEEGVNSPAIVNKEAGDENSENDAGKVTENKNSESKEDKAPEQEPSPLRFYRVRRFMAYTHAGAGTLQIDGVSSGGSVATLTLPVARSGIAVASAEAGEIAASFEGEVSYSFQPKGGGPTLVGDDVFSVGRGKTTTHGIMWHPPKELMVGRKDREPVTVLNVDAVPADLLLTSLSSTMSSQTMTSYLANLDDVANQRGVVSSMTSRRVNKGQDRMALGEGRYVVTFASNTYYTEPEIVNLKQSMPAYVQNVPLKAGQLSLTASASLLLNRIEMTGFAPRDRRKSRDDENYYMLLAPGWNFAGKAMNLGSTLLIRRAFRANMSYRLHYRVKDEDGNTTKKHYDFWFTLPGEVHEANLPE